MASPSSPPRNAAVSPPPSPNLSDALSRSCRIDDVSDDSKLESLAVVDDSSLVGWWFGVSTDSKNPYGHIIQIHADHGRYLARSYSPWQLATAKMGTPLFELNVTSSEKIEDKKQAIYLKHKAAAQDGKGIDYEPDLKPLSMPIIHLTPELTTEADLTVEDILSLSLQVNPSNATNPIVKRACSNMRNILSGNAEGKVQNAIWIDFAIGNFKKKKRKRTKGQKLEMNQKEKYTCELEKDLCRVPATLERKGCFSFCLTVEEVEEEDQQSADNVQEGYRAIDHVILDIAESMGKGKLRKNEDQSKFWPVMCRQALNQLPLLFGLTTFNKIMETVSSDPLNGLYTASNGYLVTEVIQFTRKFGQWQENGEVLDSSETDSSSETESDEENDGIEDPSEIEPCDYVEAVKLTGDPDVPAGQVVFRAKVGEKYKLPPRPALKKKFGAVARYKGKGRLTGFQKSKWVDVEVYILGKEYRKDGFALGVLYTSHCWTSYYVLKLFKQLTLSSFPETH